MPALPGFWFYCGSCRTGRPRDHMPVGCSSQNQVMGAVPKGKFFSGEWKSGGGKVTSQPCRACGCRLAFFLGLRRRKVCFPACIGEGAEQKLELASCPMRG